MSILKVFRMKYQIVTSSNEHVTENEVIIPAKDEKSAKRLAIEWVHENDGMFDERIDPIVRITECGEVKVGELVAHDYSLPNSFKFASPQEIPPEMKDLARKVIEFQKNNTESITEWANRIAGLLAETPSDNAAPVVPESELLTLLHPSDPRSAGKDLWHFVYLHGEAEIFNGQYARKQGWEYAAYDLCGILEPHPTEEGNYECDLYGRRALAVIRRLRNRSWLAGRVALYSDVKGLKHALDYESWR